MQLSCTTKRLLLRVLTPANAGLVLEYYKENEGFLDAYEPLKTDNFYTESYHRTNLSAEFNATVKKTYLRYWFSLRDDPDKLIGTLCFSNFQHGVYKRCSLGYKVHKDYLRQGYATEAVTFAMQLIFSEYDIHRIEAIVQPDNLPSIALLQSLGFEQEGYLKDVAQVDGVWTDHLLYAIRSKTPPYPG